MEITLEEFRDSLQATIKDAIDNATKNAQSTPIQPCDSIWTVLFKCGLKPSVISAPENYEGSEYLNINFTQAGSTAKEQKDQLKLWARELPKFTTIKYLWFSSGRVNQELFDIACNLPNLEGLFVEMSNIESIEILKSATALRYLNLRNSTKIRSIEPLSDLGNLRWIQLQNIKQIVELSPISALNNLEGLEFRGAPDGRHTVKSFSPLQGLLSLKWLELGGIYTEDGSLRPLATLTSLRWISLGGSLLSGKL